MEKLVPGSTILLESENEIYPGFSVNCVVFGFRDGRLKVLLTRFIVVDDWMLPGGFIKSNEDPDDAAFRLISDRTGTTDIFIRQFRCFGKPDRVDTRQMGRLLRGWGIGESEVNDHWMMRRHITLAYYVLIRIDEVNIAVRPDEEIGWFDIEDLPPLFSDHRLLIDAARTAIRNGIQYIPIGYELLPEKFTIPELQTIYEEMLGYKIDRRNFRRKLLSTGLVTALDEVRHIHGHKSPTLYKFNVDEYEKSIRVDNILYSALIR